MTTATTLDELLVEIGINTDELTSGAQGAADEVESSLGGIQAAAAGAAVGGLFMVGLTNAMDAKTANDKLANQLGLTEEEAKRAGDVAGDVFSQGFGESIDDVNAAINGVASNMGDLGDLTDTELKDMSSTVLALAKTFDQDLGATSRAVGQLLKTGMAANATEALDIIAAGFRKGADGGGDFLDTIIGGADNLKSFGFSGDQATGLIIQGLNAGAESAESVTGLFEELVGNVSAGGDDLAQTFKDLGLNGKQMTKDLTSGGPEANKALDTLLDSIRNLKDPIKQDAMMAALFGEEGAAMQNTLLAIDPSEATAALGEFGGVAKEVTDSAAASQSIDAIWRSLATTLGEMLAPALKVVGDFMAEHPVLLKILVPILIGLALAIGIAVIAQWAWNTALWAFPGTWIIAGIIALIAIIILIIVYWDEIAAATSAAWDWIVDKLSQAWDWIVAKVTGVWDWISKKIGGAWDWITDKIADGVDIVMDDINMLAAIPGKVAGWFGQIVGWVAGLPGRISKAASGMWDGIKNSFRDSINWLIWKWNNLSFTLGGGSVLGIDIPSITLNTPNIPYLAEGGITTGPTLAMIGEGTEREVVLPLSKLDGMLRGVATAVRTTGGSGEQRVVLEVAGGDSAFADFFKEVVRNKAGGSVKRLGGEEE